MEGAPNDGTSTGPAMTPIERQMQVIATSIQDLARETSRQNQELWQAIRQRPQNPHDNNQPLRREETGRTTRKLTAIKSPAAGGTELKGPHPGAGTEQRAQEALLRPVNIGQQEQLSRPSSQKGQISRPSSLND